MLVDRLPDGSSDVLHCSSMGVYASSHRRARRATRRSATPTHAMMPTYSITKIAAESMAKLPGPRSRNAAHHDRPTRLALRRPRWVSRTSTCSPSSTGDPVTSAPDQEPNWFNLIHEDDLVPSLWALLGAAAVPATVVNWADPEPVAAEEWCAELARLTGRELTIRRSEAAPPPGVMDVSRLADLGYRPTVDWRDGFRSMVVALAPDEVVG